MYLVKISVEILTMLSATVTASPSWPWGRIWIWRMGRFESGITRGRISMRIWIPCTVHKLGWIITCRAKIQISRTMIVVHRRTLFRWIWRLELSVCSWTEVWRVAPCRGTPSLHTTLLWTRLRRSVAAITGLLMIWRFRLKTHLQNIKSANIFRAPATASSNAILQHPNHVKAWMQCFSVVIIQTIWWFRRRKKKYFHTRSDDVLHVWNGNTRQFLRKRWKCSWFDCCVVQLSEN